MKKTLAFMCAVTIAASSTVMPIGAAETPAIMPTASEDIVIAPKPIKQPVTEPTTEDMERLIKIVKPKLDVPADFTEFSWNFNAPTYSRDGAWHFTWSNKDGDKHVSASADPDGNITSYSYYDRESRGGNKLPKFTKEALAKTAVKAFAALCEQPASKMKLTASTFTGFYSHSFSYTFTRFENGIIVPDNTASVPVDDDTGKVTAVSCNFNYGLTFDSTAKFDEASAKDALSEAQTMHLSYRLKTEYDDDGNRIGRTAYLVYTPEVSYLAFDAESGKVHTERNTWRIADAPTASGGSLKNEAAFDSAAAESAEGGYTLSEEELAELAVLESLITKDEAIKTILENGDLYIDPAATAVEAQLIRQRDYGVLPANGEAAEDTFVWQLRFSAPYLEQNEKNGYFSPYMNATVDAHDGSLISFRANVPDYSYYINDYKTEALPTLVFSPDEAADKFYAFAEKVVPEKISNTRLSSNNDSVVIGYITENGKTDKERYDVPIYRVSRVNFVRVNEGVDFTYNNVTGAVDRVTGKVTQFGYNWYDDVTFESPKEAITPEAAYRVLLDSNGFGLNYEINSNYTYNRYLADRDAGAYIDYAALYENEIYTRLVYSGYKYGSTTVSALGGELITYNGTPYQEKAPFVYDDISGHWAEHDIRMLCDLDIGLEGASFQPDTAITENEFSILMNALSVYVPYHEGRDETVPGDGTLTRTDAVKMLIDAAGYYKIAAMPDIFITDFADNSELLREDVGFIAIARGLGLVIGDANAFRPYDNITRAEAVTLLVNFVELSK